MKLNGKLESHQLYKIYNGQFGPIIPDTWKVYRKSPLKFFRAGIPDSDRTNIMLIVSSTAAIDQLITVQPIVIRKQVLDSWSRKICK